MITITIIIMIILRQFFMKMITIRTMMKITTLITLIIIVNEFLCKVKLMIVTNFIENDSYVKNDCQLCVCVYIYIYTPCLPRDTFRNLERTSIIGVKTRRYGTLTITRIARRMGNLFRRSRRAAKLTMNDHAN